MYILTAITDVSSDDLKQMKLFSEYSAASYCMGNTGSKGNAVKCGGGFCPSVQAAETNTLAEFDQYVAHGALNRNINN